MNVWMSAKVFSEDSDAKTAIMKTWALNMVA